MRLSAILFSTLVVLGLTAPGQERPRSTPAVPTTKVLAIGSLPGAAQGGGPSKDVMMQEVSTTVRLYLTGKIDSWYVRKDVRGVVFLMNVDTVDQARDLLEKLPLGQRKIMHFDLIPIGPLSPLNYLLSGEPNSPASPTSAASR